MSEALRAIRGIADDEALSGPAIPSTNLASFVEWFLERGGSIEDVALPFPASELRSKGRERWIDYREHLIFQKSIIDRVDGFTLPMYYDMGRSALGNRLLDSYRVLVSLVPRKTFFVLMTRLTGFLQRYTRVTVLEERRGYCRLRYDVDPAVNAYALGGLAHNVTGFASAAVEFRFGSSCEYRVIRNQNLLSNAALAAYERYGLDYRENESGAYLGGVRFAVRLAEEPGGLRIVDDVRVDGLLLFERGMVFDAPYCEAELQWEVRPSLSSLSYNGLRLLFSGLRYPETLEAKLSEAQRNYIEAERARSASELLSRELDERNRELGALVRELEDRVSSRTEDLQRALERMRDEDLIKTNLLASLSHELRTPMTLISLPLGRVVSGERGATVRCDDECLLAARRHAEELVETLDGILDFTALSAARGGLSFEPLSLDAIVRDVAAALGHEAERRGVALRLGAIARARVAGEARLLRTAIVNLAHNALKYTGSGGSVTMGVALRSRREGDLDDDPDDGLDESSGMAEVYVDDTGRGIRPEELESIFDRGFRSASAGSEPGWGLGLALVKGVAEAHGGRACCRSRRGEGSRFVIAIPIYKAEGPPGAATRPANRALGCRPMGPAVSATEIASVATRPMPGGDRPIVLYVEDNEELSAYVTERLSRLCAVETAGDAETAEVMLANRRYDLVVSDVMLPGLDGLELYRRTKARLGRSPPFLFVTARADDAMREAALDEGAVDYIRKPFDEAELEIKVRNLAAFSRAVSPSPESLRDDLLSASRSALAARGASAREVEIAMLLADGLSRKEIAVSLGIATATVKRHVENLFARLGVQDRFQLYAGFFGPAALETGGRPGSEPERPEAGNGSLLRRM
ncbi:MAG: response regulator [Spirochaetes bacterium]|nr:response regulator [Spirochaetota bacterium]MBU1080142.1 response regulator [Spirochaetota bacterium]